MKGRWDPSLGIVDVEIIDDLGLLMSGGTRIDQVGKVGQSLEGGRVGLLLVDRKAEEGRDKVERLTP